MRRAGSGDQRVVANGADVLALRAATQAEAEAGLHALAVMTPERTAQAIATLSPSELRSAFQPTNLLAHSGAPGTAAAWSTLDVTVTAGQPDPFGGTTAVTLTDSLGSSAGYFSQSVSLSDRTGWWTVSLHLKPGTSTQSELYVSIAGATVGVYIQWPTAVATRLPSPIAESTVSTTALSDGWVRVTLSVQSPAGGAGPLFVSLFPSGSGPSAQGTLTLAAPQLEAGPSAGPYVMTGAAGAMPTLVLTWADRPVHVLEPGSAGLSVCLPPVSSPPAGRAALRVLINRGRRPVLVRDSTGASTVGSVAPGGWLWCFLATTASGARWQLQSGQPEMDACRVALTSLDTRASDANDGVMLYPLTANRFVLVILQSNALRMIALEWTDTDIRLSPTEAVINAVPTSSFYFPGFALRPWGTGALITYIVNPGGGNESYYARTLTIDWSSMVITVNTAATYPLQAAAGWGLCEVRSVDGGNTYMALFSGYTSALTSVLVAVIVAGVTCTISTPVTLPGFTASGSLACFDATRAAAVYVSGGQVIANRLTVSSGSVSAGPQITVDAAATVSSCAVWRHSATTATVLYQKQGVLFARLLTDTGSTLTVSVEQRLLSAPMGSAVKPLSASQALVLVFEHAVGMQLQRLRLVGSSVEVASARIAAPLLQQCSVPAPLEFANAQPTPDGVIGLGVIRRHGEGFAAVGITMLCGEL
ncbi:MAG: hypothetical protein EAZ99_16610 [Alphaproteobacteria bacterium]|nr:MAG: hypothetical protein EAZ99_16610 [Alphaproteobacteria bacterium]